MGLNTVDVAVIAKYGLPVRDFIHDDGSGSNKVISTMAFVPKFRTEGLPQSALNGLEMGGFWVDVYHCSQPDASSISRGSTSANTPGGVAAVSQPGVVPWTDISWLNARIAASNRMIQGRHCHLITPFERASLLYLSLMSGHDIRGNNNWGRDYRDADVWEAYGIEDPVQPGYDGHDISRALIGSGPSSWWSHGIPLAGVFGLVGNIWDWEDLRIESGLIRPLAYLNGAPAAGATEIDYDDNGNGDGTNICHLTPGVYTITDATNGDEDVTIERVIPMGRFTGRAILAAGLASAHGDNCQIQLKTAVDLCSTTKTGLALGSGQWTQIGALLTDATSKKLALPDFADTATDYATYLDSWYVYENGDSRAVLRGGDWAGGSHARRGFVVSTIGTPSSTGGHFGFRAALGVGNL